MLLEKYLNQAMEKYLSLLPKYYTILKKDTVINIPYDDIVYAERKGKGIILHLENKTSYTQRTTLKELINDLGSRFMFIDRCYIVNISKIFSVKNSRAVMTDGTMLSISQSRLNEVKKKTSEYWRNKI